MMDFAKMAKDALHVYPRRVLPVARYSDRERINGLYADLTCSWCDLIEASGKADDKESVYDAFSSVMLGFFMISNEQKTTYKLLMTKEELDSMKDKWKSASFNAVCLIMQQQLLKSHFEHKIDAFVRAWHIALKFGLTDLGLDESVIVKHYDNLIR